MSSLELIEHLCAIIGKQADLIRRQATALAEYGDVGQFFNNSTEEERKGIETDIRRLEQAAGPILPAQEPYGKEEIT